MDIRLMRSRVRSMYKSKKWIRRVSMMPDEQIIAIYYSSIERDKKKEKELRKNEQIQFLFD